MVIKDILDRGKVPILEGGSLFGIKNLFKGNTMVETPEEVATIKETREKAREMLLDFSAIDDNRVVIPQD